MHLFFSKKKILGNLDIVVLHCFRVSLEIFVYIYYKSQCLLLKNMYSVYGFMIYMKDKYRDLLITCLGECGLWDHVAAGDPTTITSNPAAPLLLQTALKQRLNDNVWFSTTCWLSKNSRYIYRSAYLINPKSPEWHVKVNNDLKEMEKTTDKLSS